MLCIQLFSISIIAVLTKQEVIFSVPHLRRDVLPVLPQGRPGPGTGRLAVQAVPDLLLQLLVELLQGSDLVPVLQQAAVEGVEVGLVASLPRLGHHGHTGAPQALEEDAADAQSPAGDAGAQAAGAASWGHAHKHAPRCAGAPHSHSADATWPLGGRLAQEGGSASRKRHCFCVLAVAAMMEAVAVVMVAIYSPMDIAATKPLCPALSETASLPSTCLFMVRWASGKQSPLFPFCCLQWHCDRDLAQAFVH